MTPATSAIGNPPTPKLRRILGPVSIACVGVGVAIGSGVFATPGEIAQSVSSPWLILTVWLIAGAIGLAQSLVTAELTTRVPLAGGEYQFLKMAYGDFAAFFFGWAYTIFIVGGGVGTIAAAMGDFASQLLHVPSPWGSTLLGCSAILGVTVVNALGLRTGALAQNVLTLLKTLALIGITVGAITLSGRTTPAPVTVQNAGQLSWATFFLVLTQAMWAYDGATDSGKLAEETHHVRKNLPRALIATAMLLAVVYCLYNYALLCAMPPGEMAGARSVPAVVFERFAGPGGKTIVLVVSILVCLGALSSTSLACVRVTYALARDGLTFAVFGRMSPGQSPIASLVLVGAIACTFVLNRSFGQILRIYYLAAAVLFGLSYLSLIVFRWRDRREGRAFPVDAFRAPGGIALAAMLILMECAIAGSIVWTDWRHKTTDSLATIGLLVVLALLYVVWKRVFPRASNSRLK